MDITPHRLAWREFELICMGAVDQHVLALLKSGQYSRRRLLLSALVEKAAERPDTSGPLLTVEVAWRVLTAAEDREPAVVEDILMSPTVGVWLARVLRRLHGVDLAGPPLWVELGFLHSLAAAAAVRSGLPCALELPIVDGVVTLPTLGRFHDGRFFPTHRHEAACHGRRLTVEIDDHSPYRRFSAPEPPTPLPTAELAAWRRDLDAAWEVLIRWHPDFAAELSFGLASIAPISPPSKVIGSTAPSAFGGVGLSRATSPVVLAETLVHEYQHSKLNALMDLVILHDADSTELGYAPWRDDPRPLWGLLHGIYAFASGVEFWHVERQRVDDTVATYTFARRHRQVGIVIENLATARGLTEPGVELVDSVAQRLRACPVDDIPDRIHGFVETTLADHHARWRLRHVSPDEEYVARGLAAWHASAPMPVAPDRPPVIGPDRRAGTPHRRINLVTMSLTEPARFAEHVACSPAVADVALVTGRFEEALVGYERRLVDAPADADAWIGLGLTLQALGRPAPALLETPEVAVAVRERLPVVVAPLDFATWLSSRPATP